MIKTLAWGNTRRVVIPGNTEKTIEFCAKHFCESAKKAIETKGFFSVALSGGSTPKAVYEKIYKEYKELSIWKHVYLFWSDERCVTPDNKDSNYNMAMEAGFSSLGIPKEQIFRMKAEKDLDSHVEEYEKLLETYPLDLVLLGMGEDGHTASLFPHSKAMEETEKKVAKNYIKEKKTWRMTLTFKGIESAREAIFYVLGCSKQKTLESIFLETPPRSPCLFVGSTSHPAVWILDESAASLIEPLLTRNL